MGGLLRKDLYMLWRYCRSLLIMVAVFVLIGVFFDELSVFAFYPCVMAGLFPMTLCSYDERDKFNRFCAAMPVSRRQYVTGKYVMALVTALGVVAFSALAKLPRLLVPAIATLTPEAYLEEMTLTLVMSCLLPALYLPLIFKFGTEKGRWWLGIVFGIVTLMGVAVGFIGNAVSWSDWVPWPVYLGYLAAPLLLIGLYALSWCLSVRFYKKREL